MLKYSEIENTFNAYGIDIVEYNIETNEDIETPYVVYTANESNSFGADGINYIKLLEVAIAFIDGEINYPLQRQIEQIFDENSMTFEKAINFDEEARLYAITYNVTVIDDGNN